MTTTGTTAGRPAQGAANQAATQGIFGILAGIAMIWLSKGRQFTAEELALYPLAIMWGLQQLGTLYRNVSGLDNWLGKILPAALACVLFTGCGSMGGLQQDVIEAFSKADAAIAKASNDDGSGALDGSWGENAFTKPIMDPTKQAVEAARLLVSSIGAAASNAIGMVDGVVSLFTGSDEE